MEYQVELVQAKIQRINVENAADSSDTFQIETSQRASIFDPVDNNDPTVMIKSEFSMHDENKKLLSVDMDIDFIFKFDPIPEDRTAAASKYCPTLMVEKSVDLAATILREMGHQFVIGKQSV